MAKALKNKTGLVPGEIILNKIFFIRGIKVMIDRDLAALYEVETKGFNQAVKRNIERFPEDFMFQLTKEEAEASRSQFVTLKRGQNIKYLPYAFTEQGVAMLSGIINSPRAVQMNIAIMRAFVAMRKLAMTNKSVAEKLLKIEERLGGHDVQLKGIYDVIENLLDKKADEKNWEERERIGFKKS